MTFHGGNTKVEKYNVNCKEQDIPALFGGMLATQDRKPRGYGEYTKKCDNNSLKLGLRK